MQRVVCAIHMQKPPAREDHMQMVACPLLRMELVAGQTLFYPSEGKKDVIGLLVLIDQAAILVRFM